MKPKTSKDLIKLCIEIFTPDEAAERIVQYINDTIQIERDIAEADKNFELIINNLTKSVVHNLKTFDKN